jgi:hypothetical protein
MASHNLVDYWWYGISTIALLNILCWLWVARRFRKDHKAFSPKFFAIRGWHVFLSAGYVWGCAFRSLLPRADVQRICLLDSAWSSVAVGRSVATIAELCFVAQWAILLNEMGKPAQKRWVVRLSFWIVPAIFVAELFSWYAVLTTNYIGNSIEQSIWTLTVLVIMFALVSVRPHYGKLVRQLIAGVLALSVSYILFMVFVDIHMYVTRWFEDTSHAKQYLTFAQGWRDAVHRRVVTNSYAVWREEIAWMTLYFGPTVWVSIALIRSPRFSQQRIGKT